MTTANRRTKMKIFPPNTIGFVHRFGSRAYARRDNAKPGFECPVCTQKKLRSRSRAIYVRPIIETLKSCGSKACCRATVGTPVGMRHLRDQKVSFQSGFGFSGKTNNRGWLVQLLIQIPIQFFASVSHPDFTIAGSTVGRRFPFGLPHFGRTKPAHTLVIGQA